MFIVIIQDGAPTIYGPYPDFLSARNVANSYIFCFADVREPDECVKMPGFTITIVAAMPCVYQSIDQRAAVSSHIHDWNHNTGLCKICKAKQSDVLNVKRVGPAPKCPTCGHNFYNSSPLSDGRCKYCHEDDEA